MKDANASLVAVEKTMDMLENFRKELEDLRAYVSFDLNSLINSVNSEYARQRNNERKAELLQDLAWQCNTYGLELLDSWNFTCRKCDSMRADMNVNVGTYLAKLNRITEVDLPERTVVIDSRKYPETAQHIKATAKNAAKILTIDRSGAKERRYYSLKGVKTEKDHDRDEFPCAVFEEGGKKVHVWRVKSRDNRGAGSYMSWQMRKMKDGTKIKIRII